MANFFLAPILQVFGTDGNPASGAKISTFIGGTTTPQATFTDSTGGTPLSSPVIADSLGRVQIWLSPLNYKFVVTTSAGVALFTIDNFNPTNVNTTLSGLTVQGNTLIANPIAATAIANQSSPTLTIQGQYWTGVASANDNWVISSALGSGANPTSTLTISHSGSSGTAVFNFPSATFGNLSITGNLTVAGSASFQSENGLATVFADQFASVQAAINVLPAAGGIVNATSPNVNPALGSLNPGTKAITLYLGPLAAGYTVNQITLQTNFKIIGCGATNQTGSGQTKITSVGSNATHLMVIPQTSNTPVSSVSIQGVRFVGASGNTTQKGLFADCSTLTNSGLWYPVLTDVVFDGFVGNPIHLQGRPDNATAVNQFITMINVRAFRASAGAEALRINGGNGQIKFIGCEFDGPGISDSTAPNIFIGQTGGGDTQSPYSIDFDMLTCQGSNLGIQLSGVQGVRFQHGHYEVLHGVLQTSLVGTTANYGVVFESNDLFGTVGINAGAGFIWKDNSVQTRGTFRNNLVEGTPDKIVIGTNLSSIDIGNNPQTLSPPAWNSTNLTLGLNAAATINCQNNNSVFLQTSATPITTIQSSRGPGEIITFRCASAPVTFNTGGNLFFGTIPVPLVLAAGDQITFVFDDNAILWCVQSYSHGPTVAKTLQKAEAAADAALLTFTPPAIAGSYRLSFDLAVSAAASAVLGWTASWKDANGTAQTPTNILLSQITSQATTFTTSAAGVYSGSLDIGIDNSATAIVIKFTLASGTITAKASAMIERLI